MDFYHDIKAHMSPSAFANWHNARSQFVRSYFLGEKSPETSSMKGGKQIHALIEAGLLPAKHVYVNNEKELTQFAEFEGHTFKVLGIPDSFGTVEDGSVMFVDYKSGKENTWDSAKLAGDLKMKLTAWLVWNTVGCPPFVRGYIEYIPTQWNKETKEIEPTGEESQEVAAFTYTGEELGAFTAVIVDTMLQVNEAYKIWLESTDEFVNQDDVARYAEIEQEIKDREAEQEIIAERLTDQLGMGKKETLATPFGSFFFKITKKYVYPKDLRLEDGMLLETAEEIATRVSAAKKKFETENDPTNVSKSLVFRANKKK